MDVGVKTRIALALQLASLLNGQLEFAQIFCFADESQLEKRGSKIADEFASEKTARLVSDKVYNVFDFTVARLKVIDFPHNRRPPSVTTYFCPY